MHAATPLYLSIMPAAIPPLSLHYAFLGSLMETNHPAVIPKVHTSSRIDGRKPLGLMQRSE